MKRKNNHLSFYIKIINNLFEYAKNSNGFPDKETLSLYNVPSYINFTTCTMVFVDPMIFFNIAQYKDCYFYFFNLDKKWSLFYFLYGD